MSSQWRHLFSTGHCVTDSVDVNVELFPVESPPVVVGGVLASLSHCLLPLLQRRVLHPTLVSAYNYVIRGKLQSDSSTFITSFRLLLPHLERMSSTSSLSMWPWPSLSHLLKRLSTICLCLADSISRLACNIRHNQQRPPSTASTWPTLANRESFSSSVSTYPPWMKLTNCSTTLCIVSSQRKFSNSDMKRLSFNWLSSNTLVNLWRIKNNIKTSFTSHPTSYPHK